MSRSPRKLRTTASSEALTRRRFLAASLALPAAASLPRWLRGAQSPPYALVLGTAQDAGVPQVNCFNANCNAVRSGARPTPRVASLGLVDATGTGGVRRFLVDATPDFVDQVGDLLAQPSGTGSLDGSIPLADHLHGIFLTHAHMGHYTGLIHVGREGAAAHELPVYASAAMAAYLRANEPWAFLARNGHILLRELEPGVTMRMTPRIEVTPFAVLHRQELSDTLGFLFHGPEQTLLYLPDADRWQGWPAPPGSVSGEAFEHWLGRADIALVDGSFYSYDELGHRPQGEVPHPPVVTTMELLEDRRDELAVWFTHLNNTNPLWDPSSGENEAVRDRGFGVAEQGQVLTL